MLAHWFINKKQRQAKAGETSLSQYWSMEWRYSGEQQVLTDHRCADRPHRLLL